MDITNPSCANYDPCHDYIPLKAAFRMGQSLAYSPVPFTEWHDTLLWTGDITFEALGEYDSVQWRIGADERIWRDKKFFLGFRPLPGDPGEPDSTRRVPVTMIGWRKPRTNCDPNAPQSDTMTRLLVLTQSYKYQYVRLVGAYHVKFDNGDDKTGDTLTFYVRTIYCPENESPDGPPDGVILENLPRGLWVKDYPYGPNSGKPVYSVCSSFWYDMAFMGEFPYLHSMKFGGGDYVYALNNGYPEGYFSLAPDGRQVSGELIYYQKHYHFSGTKIR